MSDYLNSIVLRSLNLATVVQPRVPQLFEEAPAPRPDAPQPAIISNATGVRDELPQVSATPRSQQNAPHTTVAAKTAGEIQPPLQPPFAMPSFNPAPQVSEPASLVRSVSPDTSQPPAVPAANVRTQTPAEAEHAVSTIRPTGDTHEEQQHLLLSAARATANSAPIQSQLSPAFAPNITAAPQSMPIRISIGRVDVRAIMPAAPAKATAATRAKPALSLENYLKQREEGKR